MLAMTLSEIADRVLKGSGFSQPPPGKGPPGEAGASLERAPSTSQAHSSSGPENNPPATCGGMVGNTFGEPRGFPANVPSWAKARTLSDIRELT